MADNGKTDEATRLVEVDHGQASPPSTDLVPVDQVSGLLVPQPAPMRVVQKRRWLRVAVMVAVLIGVGGGYYWWQHLRSQLPPGIAYGNGRLEADAINIDTKYAGRIAELFADEGDLVKGRTDRGPHGYAGSFRLTEKGAGAGQAGKPRRRRSRSQCEAAAIADAACSAGV